MYFFSEEERKWIVKSLMPRTRSDGVAEELRGWNWHQPPLEKMYDVPLALYEVAGKYCPTVRDLYLRRVAKAGAKTNEAMHHGKVLHNALMRLFVQAKRLIYIHGVDKYSEILSSLFAFSSEQDSLTNRITDETLREKIKILYAFETSRIAARIQDVLTRQPFIGEDSLVSQALPIATEQKLDGSFLGLSAHLSADAAMLGEPMIIDLKFGEPKDFHRLTTTGYALVMEALYDYPVNLGCIVYGEFKNGRLFIKKDIHAITDELRQWFIEERDEKMRMIYEQIEPGKPEKCPETCPYADIC